MPDEKIGLKSLRDNLCIKAEPITFGADALFEVVSVPAIALCMYRSNMCVIVASAPADTGSVFIRRLLIM